MRNYALIFINEPNMILFSGLLVTHRLCKEPFPNHLSVLKPNLLPLTFNKRNGKFDVLHTVVRNMWKRIERDQTVWCTSHLFRLRRPSHRLLKVNSFLVVPIIFETSHPVVQLLRHKFMNLLSVCIIMPSNIWYFYNTLYICYQTANVLCISGKFTFNRRHKNINLGKHAYSTDRHRHSNTTERVLSIESLY